MKNCEVCGNEYNHLIEIRKNGKTHYFDCFECAAHKLAPECSHCGVKILGHGVQADDKFYCGAHYSRTKGCQSIVHQSSDWLLDKRVI